MTDPSSAIFDQFHGMMFIQWSIFITFQLGQNLLKRKLGNPSDVQLGPDSETQNA